ncbi:SIS domain-containing protein [Chryseomicrobium palamuruense]
MQLEVSNVLEEIAHVVKHTNIKDFTEMEKYIQKGRRLFLYGEGRSGLMVKAFGMRLMHAGYTVFIIGETTTPSIGEGDVLLILSGSGESTASRHIAETSKKSGATPLLVTANPELQSNLLYTHVALIPAATKHRLAHEPDTIQPLGNQFDQSAHLLLDSLVIYLNRSNEHFTNDALKNQHTNI